MRCTSTPPSSWSPSAAGGILAGIIGVFLAVPVAGVVSVVLQYAQDRPPPETPLSESPAAAD